ncbi:sugar ABC transporter ATP-binding protein [Christensenella tenuis]|uniref:Sugar ABC transporter ATP-binding protein n=1 Tax=Christensenella tenuis TaxID=2763033 RepID=A0ABR7EIQ3_9FIRM|nr:sugar ABC transporter ATP-binding protein [Christensenella tenuis]MBC5648894.1 sugar ABC transporter ATP-binding protein [Christensenella tenuis]
MGKILLRAENITKDFPGVKALDHVKFELEKGEVHALLGENGAGKSTLIKILCGVYHQDSGQIYVDDKPAEINSAKDALDLGISTIHQELNIADNLSVAENIFFGRLPNKRGLVDRKSLVRDAKKILDRIGLQVDPQTKARFLSIAKKQMLEIGKSLSLNARVIIMDEPTSSLSPEEIDTLFDIIRELKRQQISIIYISHKLEEIFEVCDRITVLRDGQYIGTAQTGQTNKEELIKMMVGREANIDYKRNCSTCGKTILQVKELTTDKIKKVSFEVKAGEIVGFSGLMGAGKSEIARALFGLDEVRCGTVALDGKTLDKVTPICCMQQGIGYVPEDRKADGLFLNLTVGENMSVSSINQFTKGPVINKKAEMVSSQEQVAQLKIKTPSLKQKIRNLSGGNQQKAIIARWLLKSGLKLLIIDEPTRGIDVGAKFEIYTILSQLAQNGVALLVMSSEIEELTNMCDRIIVMREGRISAVLNNEEADQTSIMKYSVK